MLSPNSNKGLWFSIASSYNDDFYNKIRVFPNNLFNLYVNTKCESYVMTEKRQKGLFCFTDFSSLHGALSTNYQKQYYTEFV